jgi:hypothetical protein
MPQQLDAVDMVGVDMRDDEQLDIAHVGRKGFDMRTQCAERAERTAIDEHVMHSTRFAVLDPDAVAVQRRQQLTETCRN